MSSNRWVRRGWVLVALAAVPLVAGCGGDDEEMAAGDGGGGGSSSMVGAPTSTTDPVRPRESSSPFTVGPVPDGYQVVAVGRGDAEGAWGWDCCGTDEPFTVLSPDGTPTHPEVVVVAATGFAGYEGGLEQASAGYVGAADPIDVDGHQGFFTSAAANDGWAELVVEHGDDLAIRVTQPGATRDDLIEILGAVEDPDDQGQAPLVPSPPAGLQVVGSARLDAVLARNPSVSPGSAPPGPPSAHSVGWLAGEGDDAPSLLVAALPGSAGDAAALAVPTGEVGFDVRVERRDIEGRPAYVVDWSQYDDPHRSVWLDSSWGDLVVVTASGGDLPSADELVAVAASVRPTDTATWDAAVTAGIAPPA